METFFTAKGKKLETSRPLDIIASSHLMPFTFSSSLLESK